MPTQIGSAKFVGISSVNVSLIGQKVRLVGRLLAFDALHALVTLLDSDGKHTLIVDVQDVLDETSNAWATERLGPVLVMGYVEEPAEALPAVEGHPFVRGILHPPRNVVARALLVLPAEDVDLKLWDAVVNAERGEGSR